MRVRRRVAEITKISPEICGLSKKFWGERDLVDLFQGDDRYRQINSLTMRAAELQHLFKLLDSIDAKNTFAKAVRSPFMANGFALAYA